MQAIKLQPFNSDELIVKLQEAFPQYSVKKSWGNCSVRTKKFTVTGNVSINLKPAKGIIRTQTALDMAFMFLVICFPLGIYCFIKAKKQRALEQEVVDKIKAILSNGTQDA